MKLYPVLPTLKPGTLGAGHPLLPFPLDRPRTQLWFLGRNAIYAALGKLALPEGSPVIVPSYTNGVEVGAIAARGLKPIPVRILPDFTLDLEELSRTLERTHAPLVLAIHYLGFAQPVDAILEICRAHGARLLEDCALSFLARLPDGRPVGSVGDLAIYSLYKTLPVPDGAALVVNDPDVPLPDAPEEPELASSLSSLGRLVLNGARSGGPARRVLAGGLELTRRAVAALFAGAGVERTAPGSMRFETRRLPWGASRFTRAILPRLDYPAIYEARRKNFLQLRQRLEGIPTFFRSLPEGACPLFYPVVVADKPAFRAGLTARGIESVDFWSTFHPATPPREPEIAWLRHHVVEIPCLQDLDEEGVEYVAEAVLNVLGRRRPAELPRSILLEPT